MAPKKKNFLSGFADALGQIAEVVSSAGELLVDADLRRKGAQFIGQEVSRGINEAQKGIEAGADALGRSIRQGANARFGAGARQLQSVLRNIEKQIQDFQRQQQQRDLASELEHHHKLPVDIQIGDQVYEDMPQEMRSRFWYVLLERPDLAVQLLKGNCTTTTAAAAAAAAWQASGSGGSSSNTQSQEHAGQQHLSQQPAQGIEASSSSRLVTATADASAEPQAGVSVPVPTAVSVDVASPTLSNSGTCSPFAAVSCSTDLSDSAAQHTHAQPASGRSGDGSSPRQGDTAAAAGGAAVGAATAGDNSGASRQQQGVCASSLTTADDANQQVSCAAGAVGGSSTTVQPVHAVSVVSEQGSALLQTAAAAESEAAAAAVLPEAPSPWVSGHNVTAVEPPVTSTAAGASAAVSSSQLGSTTLLAPSPWDPPQQAAAAPQPASPAAAHALPGAAADDAVAGSSLPAAASAAEGSGSNIVPPEAAGGAAAVPVHTSSTGAEVAGAAAAAPSHALSAHALSSTGDGEGWEMVSRNVPTAMAGSTGELETLDAVRTLVESMSEEAALDGHRAAKQAVFQAMLQVPWVAGEGIPDSPTDGTEYAALLEAGCGSIEDVILRDVPRTFPEHPFFNTPAGQQKLFRVLKAYAAADPEVGYCQGMAFAAGVLLMFVPEEPAFRLFQRLMSPEGPNLRRYYLPGLEHLKIELSCFELLLSSHQPLLHQHLLDAGLPALLYAAQWLMTSYSCPFPMHVAARVLDVLLQSDSDAMLPRMGLAVMEALSSKLLELDDFEELITYLKVKPLSWPLHMHRKVFDAALSSAATDAELQAATAAAREEFLRCGRAASFSSKHLSRQATLGGTTRHELAPGPMGPKTLAATEAAADNADSAISTADGTQPDAAAASSSSGQEGQGVVGGFDEGPGSSASNGSSSSQQQQRLPSARTSLSHDDVLVGPVGSGIPVDDLEDLITDLDLLLPGGVDSDDSEEPTQPAEQQQKEQKQQ